MVTEIDLVKKIQELKKIRPRKDWVVLIKSQILAEPDRGRASISFFPFWKPVLATVTALGILFGIFTFSQNALPGDILYSIKKMTEKGQAVFVSEEEKPVFQLKLANERLEDLTKIAETNQVKKIAPALEEYQASISEAAKNLAQITATTSDPVVIKKIAEQTQKLTQELEEKKEKLEKTYGIAGLEFKEESNPTKVLVEWLIEDLESQTLTEEKENILSEKMKELAENGKHSEALEIYLININQ
jgi:hypothetical protein